MKNTVSTKMSENYGFSFKMRKQKFKLFKTVLIKNILKKMK